MSQLEYIESILARLRLKPEVGDLAACGLLLRRLISGEIAV